jgi:hypothetical protein
MSLEEATDVLSRWANTTGHAGETFTLTRREVEAVNRLLTDARITLACEQIPSALTRRKGRSQ